MALKFESEEQLQEYLTNLGTEYRFSCFHEKNAEGCHLLGDYLEAVKKDFDAAASIFKSNCDERKYAKSCYKFGNFSFLGKGLEPNSKTAWEYYKTACELGQSSACLNAGVMLTNPETDSQTNKPAMEKDYVTGLKYMEKACSANNVRACYFASGIYITGAEGVPQNKAKAAQLSHAACDGGNIYACMNLSQMYKKGDGVEKDEIKSDMFRKKAKELREDLKKKSAIGLQQYT